MGLIVLALPSDLVQLASATFHRRAADVRAADPQTLPSAVFTGVDVLVVACEPHVLTAALVAACDAAGVRIAPYAPDVGMHRLAHSFGLAPLTMLQEDQILAHPVPRERAPVRGGVTVVWGPLGAPGRSTVAVSLAVALAHDRDRVALVDADSHAPSIAQRLNLSDDGPGFAAVCRAAQRRALDSAELARVSQQVATNTSSFAVLAGINRPSRWPELSAQRVADSLQIMRGWAEHVVVDVAPAIEQDEELVSDIAGPRRNAATIASLQAADHIIAVGHPDAVGLSRFIRAHRDLTELVPAGSVHVVMNRLRAGVVGIDAKGQVRHALSRFAGISEVSFIPDDPAATDTALLYAQPVATGTPFAAAIERIATLVKA